MAGPVTLHFGKEVVIEHQELKVILHSKPFLLLGADVLCEGRTGWSYCSIGVGATSWGVVTFANGRRTVALPLVNAPVYGRPCFVSPVIATKVNRHTECGSHANGPSTLHAGSQSALVAWITA